MKKGAVVLSLMTCFLFSCVIPGEYNLDPKTYYVDGMDLSASDDNDGTQDHPWKTLTQAGNTAIAGDTVEVKEATYTVGLFPHHSGNESQPITFRAYSNDHVIIEPFENHGIYLSGVLFIRIEGFEIKNAPKSGICIQNPYSLNTSGPASFITVINNTIHHCGNGDELGHGIYIGGDSNHIVDNVIYNNGVSTSSVGTHGIYLMGNDNIVESNQCTTNAFMGVRSEGENNIVRFNTLSNNADLGMSIWADWPLKAKNFSIHHNLMVNNKNGGLRINGGGGGIPDGIEVYNNTIINETTAPCGVAIFNGCKNVRLANNIIFGDYSNAIFYVNDDCSHGLYEDYNIFYGTDEFVYLDDRGSFAEYLRVIGLTHTLFTNPELESDYSLKSNSVALNSGVDLGFEYLGSGVDIGWIEYNE